MQAHIRKNMANVIARYGLYGISGELKAKSGHQNIIMNSAKFENRRYLEARRWRAVRLRSINVRVIFGKPWLLNLVTCQSFLISLFILPHFKSFSFSFALRILVAIVFRGSPIIEDISS